MVLLNKRTLASILLLLISVVSFSQGPPPPAPPPPPGLPIDGYLFIFIILGLFYGIKKNLKNQNT